MYFDIDDIIDDEYYLPSFKAEMFPGRNRNSRNRGRKRRYRPLDDLTAKERENALEAQVRAREERYKIVLARRQAEEQDKMRIKAQVEAQMLPVDPIPRDWEPVWYKAWMERLNKEYDEKNTK